MILSEDVEPGTTLNVDYGGSELVIGLETKV